MRSRTTRPGSWRGAGAAWCIVLAAWGSAPAVAQGLTALKLRGDIATWPGSGVSLDLTEADGTFEALHGVGDQREAVQVSFAGDTEWWRLSFSAPVGAALTPGVYLGALSFFFPAPTKPGFDVTGDYAGCGNFVWGRFVVLEAKFGQGTEVVSFAADFEQHCNEGDPNAALFGSIRYHSSVDLTPRISVGSTADYEGDLEPRALGFQIMASERASQPITVDYATVDGSAIAGPDYQAVSGSLRLNIGEAGAIVWVPVVANTIPQPDRMLTLKLRNPVGASLGFAEGTGTIVDDDAGRTFLFFQSDPGDFVGYGKVWTLTPFDGTITTYIDAGAILVQFKGFTEWSTEFAPPAGTVLLPGVYEGVQRWPFQSPTKPGLSVDGEGRGCNELTGRFVVLEAQYGPTGDVERLAVDFEQHCEGVPPALFGAVRLNSTVDLQPRVSVAPAAIYEGDGEAETMRFWLSLSAPASAEITVDYTTADGSAKAGMDFASVSGTATFHVGETTAFVEVPILGNTVAQPDRAFTLVLSNVVGVPVGFGEATGTVLDDDSSRTFIWLSGDGDWVVGKRNFTLTPLDGVIWAESFEDGIQVIVDGGASGSWSFVFVGRSGERLDRGVYEGATAYGIGVTYAAPALDVSGEGRGCGYTGRFVVLDVQYGPNGEILSLAVDFESHCDGGPIADFGSVRINSAIRSLPRISVAPAAAYEGNGEPVNLSFWVSLSARVSTPVTVDYKTVDGSGRAGTDYVSTTGTVTFEPGVTAVHVNVPLMGNASPQADRSCSLELGNSHGAPIAFGHAIGTIADDDALRTYIVFDSDAGDSIGLGQHFTLRPLDGIFSAGVADRAIHVNFARSEKSWWDLFFAPPAGSVLSAGLYQGALRYSFFWASRPGLSVAGDGRGCNDLSGRFLVLEMEYGANGEVESFAVDFEQHCENRAPALYGSVRYNSALPADPRKNLAPRVRRHLGQA